MLARDFPVPARLAALCARHPELSRLGPARRRGPGRSRRSATPISGGASNIPTWIAAARRGSAASRSAARRRSGIRRSPPPACSTPSARATRCCGATTTSPSSASGSASSNRGPRRHRGGARRSRRRYARLRRLSRRRRTARSRPHLAAPPRKKGVFGVPSFVVDGELFWGREHLPDIREMLRQRCPRPDASAPATRRSTPHASRRRAGARLLSMRVELSDGIKKYPHTC